MNCPGRDLAFLPLETEEASTYLREMRYCLDIALANRQLVASRVRDALRNEIPEAAFGEAINIHHNYASLENHFGQDVLVHGKGATSAREGEIGIIPGSQGTASYIEWGKGNPDSFMSCSHGAGRKMGRQAAIRNLDLESEKKALEEKGILHAEPLQSCGIVRNRAQPGSLASFYWNTNLTNAGNRLERHN